MCCTTQIITPPASRRQPESVPKWHNELRKMSAWIECELHILQSAIDIVLY